MQLEFKEDFQMARKRLEAWWNCELIDRPCVQVKSKKSVNLSEIPVKDHLTMRQHWMDIEYQVDKLIRQMQQYTYLGEALPVYYPNLGPDLWATLYGAELKFGEDTSWAQHYVEDWDLFLEEYNDFTPDFNNQYWQTIEAMFKLSLEKGSGKFLTGLPDLHPGADLLAGLRDVDQLCFDLINIPDKIKYINDRLTEKYPLVYDRLYKYIEEENIGTTTWLSTYHQGKFYVPSCDFSALISPEMFQNIFLPGIRKEIDFLDRSIYHLDGPDALRHLDALLEIPDLNAIQWVYGAGNGPSTNWIDVYKKIQEAGKSIQVIVEDPVEIKTLMEELNPGGLLFTVGKVLSETEGLKIIEMVKNF